MVIDARPIIADNYKVFKEMVINGKAVFFRKEGTTVGYLHAKCPVSLKRMPESFPGPPNSAHIFIIF